MPAPTHVASALGNDGTTQTGDNEFDIVVPGSATVGMVAVITAVVNSGVETYSLTGGAGGWTTWSGPDDQSSNLRTYVWAKELQAGDMSATITVDCSATGRLIGRMDVFQDVDFANCDITFSQDSTADTTVSAPGITIADTNFLILTYWHMRAATGPAADISSYPANHSTIGGLVNTVVADPDYSIAATVFTPTGTTTQGSGSATADKSVSDRVYSIALAGTSSSTQNLDPTSIATAAALGQPTISTTVTSAPTAIATGAALGSPTISTAITTAPTAIATAAALGTPALSTTVALAPDAITTEAALGEPTITSGTSNLAPTSIESLGALGEPTVTFGIAVEVDGIPSEESLGEPELYTPLTVVTGDIATEELLTAPVVQQQTLYRVFNPPYEIHNHRIEGSLVASLHYGISVFRIDGEWDSALYPTVAQETGADLFYRGGHKYDLTDEEVTALEAEGYTVDTEFRNE